MRFSECMDCFPVILVEVTEIVVAEFLTLLLSPITGTAERNSVPEINKVARPGKTDSEFPVTRTELLSLFDVELRTMKPLSHAA